MTSEINNLNREESSFFDYMPLDVRLRIWQMVDDPIKLSRVSKNWHIYSEKSCDYNLNIINENLRHNSIFLEIFQEIRNRNPNKNSIGNYVEIYHSFHKISRVQFNKNFCDCVMRNANGTIYRQSAISNLKEVIADCTPSKFPTFTQLNKIISLVCIKAISQLNVNFNSLKISEVDLFTNIHELDPILTEYFKNKMDTELRLIHVATHGIPEKLIKLMPKLKRLYLNSAFLKSISSTLFDKKMPLKWFTLVPFDFNKLHMKIWPPTSDYEQIRHIDSLRIENAVNHEIYQRRSEFCNQNSECIQEPLVKSLPAEIGYLSQLVRLDLHGNKLKELPSLSNLILLRTIIVSKNCLNHLDLSGNQSLIRLYAQDNLLTAFPTIGSKKIKIMDLSENNLSEIPDYIDQLLPSIQNLDLSSNRIQKIPREIMMMTEVSSINFCNNQIVEYPDGLEILGAKVQVDDNPLLPAYVLKMREQLNSDIKIILNFGEQNPQHLYTQPNKHQRFEDFSHVDSDSDEDDNIPPTKKIKL